MEEAERRKRFAYQLLRDPENVYKAGFAAYPEGDGIAHALAMEAATLWPDDSEMIQLQAELIEKYGENHFLPSKSQLAREVFKTVQNGKTAADKTAAAKVYAEIMGFIEKPAPAVQVNQNNITNKVMVVPMAPSNEDWEAKAQRAQAKLFAEASS